VPHKPILQVEDAIMQHPPISVAKRNAMSLSLIDTNVTDQRSKTPNAKSLGLLNTKVVGECKKEAANLLIVPALHSHGVTQ